MGEWRGEAPAAVGDGDVVHVSPAMDDVELGGKGRYSISRAREKRCVCLYAVRDAEHLSVCVSCRRGEQIYIYIYICVCVCSGRL